MKCNKIQEYLFRMTNLFEKDGCFFNGFVVN